MKKKYPLNFPHGIMFHRFHKKGKKSAGIGSISQDDLEKILKFIGIKNIVTPNQWIEKIKNKTLKKKDICLTFDDGLKSQYNCALPILNKYNLKAFFFVYSSVFDNQIDNNEFYNKLIFENFKDGKEFSKKFFETLDLDLNIFKNKKYLKYYLNMKKYSPFYDKEEIKYRYIRNYYLSPQKLKNIMTKIFKLKKVDFIKARSLWLNLDELKKLNNLGHTIGLHSDTHNSNFKGLSFNKQKQEYERNCNFIYKTTKYRPLSMSHPLGSYNKNTLKILKQMKIVCGFRSTLLSDSKINNSNLEFAREDPFNILKMLKN